MPFSPQHTLAATRNCQTKVFCKNTQGPGSQAVSPAGLQCSLVLENPGSISQPFTAIPCQSGRLKHFESSRSGTERWVHRLPAVWPWAKTGVKSCYFNHPNCRVRTECTQGLTAHSAQPSYILKDPLMGKGVMPSDIQSNSFLKQPLCLFLEI